MFLIHSTVREEAKECLDVKMYESLSREEDSLISHTRVYHDASGKLAQRVLFQRNSEQQEKIR